MLPPPKRTRISSWVSEAADAEYTIIHSVRVRVRSLRPRPNLEQLSFQVGTRVKVSGSANARNFF